MSENPVGDPRTVGARLREAREARGWTQQEAASRLGVARTTMVALEKGERRLKPEELIDLAALYARSVSDFLRRSDSPVEGFAVQLRSSVRQSDHVEASIGEFQQLSEDYLFLEEQCKAPLRRRYPPEYEIDGADAELSGEDVAASERSRLALGESPLINLREILESDVGLRVFQLNLPSKVAGMFAFTERLGGCIAVNRHHPMERRRASLAHEYGHFLTARYRAEITSESRYERRPASERFAEAFSRAFLMPAAGLRRRYLELERNRPHGPTNGDLCRLAHFYLVSVEGMTRRLEELRLIPLGTWDRLRQEGFRVREAQQLLRLDPIYSDDELLPTRFVALAVEAWQKALLSEGQLAKILRMDRLGARETILRLEGAVPDSSQMDLGAPLQRAVGS